MIGQSASKGYNTVEPVYSGIENQILSTLCGLRKQHIRTDNEQERRLVISILTCSTFAITFFISKKKWARMALRNSGMVYVASSYLLYKPNINPF